MIRRLGRNVVVLGAVSFLTDISSEMLYPIIPLFLTTTLGAPMAVVGLVEGVAESTASLLKVASGWASDRVGRRLPFVVAGYSLSAVSKPLLALATTWPLVLVARVVDRFGKGVRTSPRDALLAASAPDRHRGEAFGLHRAMDTAGAAVGPMVAIWALGQGVSYRPLFLIAFVPAVLSVAALALVRPVRATGDHARTTPRTPAPAVSLAAALTPDVRRFLLAIGVFALGNSSDVFLLLKVREMGYSDIGVLWVYVFYNVCFAAASVPAGWLSDRLSRRGVITTGLLLFGGVYAGFAAGVDGAGLWLLLAAYGFYAAATEGILKAYVADLVPAPVRATALGAYQTVTGLLALVASVVAGLLWTYLGDAAPFVYGAACALASAIAFRLLCRPGRRHP